MTLMWLLLTVTVTCLCASPRCRSNPASLSVSAYCQKLCLWGRGGNLCHCNAVHFVGKRRDVRQQQSAADDQETQALTAPGQNLAGDDDVGNRLWTNEVDYDDDDDDDDAPFKAPDDWLDDENSTSADEVWSEASPDLRGPSPLVRGENSRRRRQSAIYLALRRRPTRRQADDQLLGDSAKKGERHQQSLIVDDANDDDDRRGLVTLNVLTRKPTILGLPSKTKQLLRKITSRSCEFHNKTCS